MKKRVTPFGIGKHLIRINMSELPEDIQESLKGLGFENTEKLILCSDIVEDTTK